MEQHALSILNTRFKDENAVRIVHPNLNSNVGFGEPSYGLLGELSATHSLQLTPRSDCFPAVTTIDNSQPRGHF